MLLLGVQWFSVGLEGFRELLGVVCFDLYSFRVKAYDFIVYAMSCLLKHSTHSVESFDMVRAVPFLTKRSTRVFRGSKFHRAFME